MSRQLLFFDPLIHVGNTHGQEEGYEQLRRCIAVSGIVARLLRNVSLPSMAVLRLVGGDQRRRISVSQSSKRQRS